MKKTWLYLSLFLFQQCQLEDPTEGIKESDIIFFSTDQATEIVADNQDAAAVTIHLGPRAGGDKEIVFNTDYGHFEGAQSSSNPRQIKVKTTQRQATAFLVADRIPRERVGITATIGDLTIAHAMAFTPSYPDSIFLTSDKLILNPDRTDFATFTVLLKAAPDKGEVSDKLLLSIKAKPVEGTVTADVIPFVETDEQRAIFTIKSQNEQPGKVEVAVHIRNGTGQIISASRTIEFKI